jgi:hypothetical protein
VIEDLESIKKENNKCPTIVSTNPMINQSGGPGSQNPRVMENRGIIDNYRFSGDYILAPRESIIESLSPIAIVDENGVSIGSDHIMVSLEINPAFFTQHGTLSAMSEETVGGRKSRRSKRTARKSKRTRSKRVRSKKRKLSKKGKRK